MIYTILYYSYYIVITIVQISSHHISVDPETLFQRSMLHCQGLIKLSTAQQIRYMLG